MRCERLTHRPQISNNRFSSIPAGIMSLQALEVLNLTSNSLTSLPTEMCTPPHLCTMSSHIVN